MRSPLVSVWMITYNQEKYIAQAIESVLMQKTTFDFEIVIGEDCSTDDTRKIVKQYQLKNPQKINAIYQSINVGARRNAYEFALPQCRGRYIACLEGDDYWTDPDKLQKQVDFLESNQTFGMVCTNYSKFLQNRKKFKRNCFGPDKYDKEVRFDDYILDMSSIGTATVMFRRAVYDNYAEAIPKKLRNEFVVGDTPFWLFIAATSKIAVLPCETAVYRILDDSACHFSDPSKHFDFVKKGFHIADYFLSKFAVANDAINTKLRIKKNRAELLYGFRKIDKNIASAAYKKLMISKLASIKRISLYLYLIGSYGKMQNKIIKAIFKIYFLTRG